MVQVAFVTFVNNNYCRAEFWPSVFITCETLIYFQACFKHSNIIRNGRALL